MHAPAVTEAHVAAALDALRAAWSADLRTERRERSADVRDYLYLSAVRDCTRRMALDLLHPEDEPDPSDDALDRMRRGKDREDAILAILARAARRSPIPFSVQETQLRLELRDRGVLIGVGKIDCRLRFANGVAIISDVKSGEIAARCNDLGDVLRNKWSAHWLDQVLLYCYQQGEPWGMLILDRPGTPLFLPISLEDHLERVETTIQAMRRAVDARFERVPLPERTQNADECSRCPHRGRSCGPDADFGAGARIITDEHLIQLAEIREAHAAAAKAYDRADAELKKALRGTELGLLGPFTVRGKYSASTSYDVPSEIKAQYKVVDPKGKWTLTECARIGSAEDAA